MKRVWKRMAAAVLAVMMLCTMGAFAEANKVTVQFASPAAAFEGSVLTGYDEDGCQQIVFDVMDLYKFLLQADNYGITAGNDETGYISMDYESIALAYGAVSNGLRYGLPAETAVRLTGYFQNPEILEDDLVLLEMVLAAEANRFSAAALEMGFVTVSETGDLTVEATAADVGTLLNKYAASLAADESAFDLIFAMEIVNAMGLNTPEMRDAALSIPYIIMSLAETAAEIDAGFKVEIKAEGSMNARLYFAQNSRTNEITAKYDMNGFVLKIDMPGMEYDFSANADMTEIALFAKEGTETFTYTLDNGFISYEYENTDDDANLKIFRLNGTADEAKVYAKFGKIDTFALNGALYAEDGDVVFDGTFDKLAGTLEYKRLFEARWDPENGVFTAEYESFGDEYVGGEYGTLDYADKGEFRFEKVETGYKGTIETEIECTYEGIAVETGSVNAEVDIDLENGAVNAAIDILFDFEGEEDDVNNSVSICLSNDVIEFKVSDGVTEERIYVETSEDSKTLYAGKSVTALADGVKTDKVLFAMESDLSRTVFANQETGVSFEAAINGSEGNGKISTPAAAIEFEYAVKEGSYGTYIEFAGNVNGEPFSGEAGISVLTYGFVPYLEMTVNGVTERISMPVTVMEDEDASAVSVSLAYASGDETMTIAELTVKNEITDDVFTHKEGIPMTAEEAVELIYALLSVPY